MRPAARRALLLAGALLLPALLLAAQPAAACHEENHRFRIRGNVKFADGTTQAGIDVKVPDPNQYAGAEGPCSGKAQTDLGGNYEIVVHMHPANDDGKSVQVQVVIGGRVVATKTITANLKPNAPATEERFQNGVDFSLPVGDKPRFDVVPFLPYIGGAALAVAIAGVVIWDFRRVKASRIAEQVDRKRSERLTPEERKKRAEARRMETCDVCGARVRADRMDQHDSRVHPKRR
jgi:hypothetical protein